MSNNVNRISIVNGESRPGDATGTYDAPADSPLARVIAEESARRIRRQRAWATPAAVPSPEEQEQERRPRRPQLLMELCSSCVFRPGNLMHLEPGHLAELIRRNLNSDAALICHQTLPYGDHSEVGEAVCRGFYDAYRRDVVAIRVVEALGGFAEIPPPA